MRSDHHDFLEPPSKVISAADHEIFEGGSDDSGLMAMLMMEKCHVDLWS